MDNFRKILTTIVLCFILALVLVTAGKPSTTDPATSYGGDASVYVGGQPYYLSGTGLTSSASSIGLTDFSVYKNDGTKYELLTADVAGTSGSVFMTIEPGNSTKQEFVSCTTVTQGSGTSATLSGCSRGLLPFSPYTASSTYAFPHNGGAKIIISNNPGFYNQFSGKANDESISGTWTFADSPILSTECTVASGDTEICGKAYIDSTANAGASDANLTTKGIVEIATQTQAASSTTLGETGAYLAIPANMATDTPNTATRASRVLMSDLTGYLKQGWINLTESFTWAGAHVFNGTATFNSTTTADSGHNVGFPNYYGDGSDGAHTVAGTETLTSDKYYTDLTVPNGTILNTAGYVVYVSGTFTNAGTVRNIGGNGGNASASTAGTAGVGGTGNTLTAGLSGGAGGSGGPTSGGGGEGGGNGTNSTGFGSSGSIGGHGASGQNGGICEGGGATSTAGVITADILRTTIKSFNVAVASSVTSILAAILGNGDSSGIKLAASASSGAGAGGGGSDSGLGYYGGGGGGGGGNGGIVEIIAKTFINTGTISVAGGNGGNGGNSQDANAAGGGGGGGGGQGGLIIIIAKTITDNGTLTVSGGTAGAIGTGYDGSCSGGTKHIAMPGVAGSVGKYYKILVK